MPSQRDQEWWSNSASAAARNPAAWLYSAEQLKRAADAVLEFVRRDWENLPSAFQAAVADEPMPPPVAGQYMMLAGFAIENLAKGLLIVSNPAKVQPDPAKPDRLFRWDGSGHLLQRLLNESGESLSPAETELVARLETFINWAGRYPVALSAMKMAHAPGEQGPARMSADDVSVFEALHERLRARLWTEAVGAGERTQADESERRKQRRAELLEELQGLERDEQDSVTRFLQPGKPNQPASAVGCGTCGAGFTLAPDAPAAICRCHVLHHCEIHWDASLAREMPTVESYPPPKWPPWYALNLQRRLNLVALREDAIPAEPGVYALYNGGQAVYVGKAKSLRRRIWANHCAQGMSMSNSAFRRNVAEHLQIALANAIKTGSYRPTAEDARQVRAWAESCDVAWVVCSSEKAAKDLEDEIKRQWRPPLTKR